MSVEGTQVMGAKKVFAHYAGEVPRRLDFFGREHAEESTKPPVSNLLNQFQLKVVPNYYNVWTRTCMGGQRQRMFSPTGVYQDGPGGWVYLVAVQVRELGFEGLAPRVQHGRREHTLACH
jgi:hypothetical protein